MFIQVFIDLCIEKMPITSQFPQWNELLCCNICGQVFANSNRQPVSLACGHTGCRPCLSKLTGRCPFDQVAISIPPDRLPSNAAFLRIIEGYSGTTKQEDVDKVRNHLSDESEVELCLDAVSHLVHLASFLHRIPSDRGK